MHDPTFHGRSHGLLLGFCVAGAMAGAAAAQNLVPELIQFQPNTPARASEVNDNFRRLAMLLGGNLTGQHLLAGSIGRRELDPALLAISLDPGSVLSVHIADRAVLARHLAPGAVGADALGPGIIDGTHLTPGAVAGSHIQAGAIDGTHIASGAVTGRHVADGAIQSVHLLASSILNSHLSSGCIASINIRSGAVQSAQLAAGAVQSGHLLAGAVGSTQLAASAVRASHIGAGEIASGHIRGGAIGGRELANYFEVAGRAAIGVTSAGGGGLWLQNKTNTNDGVYAGPVGGSGDGGLVSVYNTAGQAVAQLQPDGDIWCTGTVYGQRKAFVHPHPEDPMRQIVYIALEGAESGTYFRGRGQLVAGEATIVPPRHWQLVTAADGITVQVTPRGECAGLYVAEATRDRIVVRELGKGGSSVDFDYLVNGVRSGFEHHQPVEPNTMFLPKRPVPVDELGSGVARDLVRNGILRADGTVNEGLVEAIRRYHAELIPTPAAAPRQ